MYALSPSVHGGATVFGTAGILDGSVAISIACCQQRPGHDAYNKSPVLQRRLRSIAKRVGLSVARLHTTKLPKI